jgi:hypothetical protein
MKTVRHILVLIMTMSYPIYAGAFPSATEPDKMDELFQANNPFELTLETDMISY